jgi:hypothetical protein
MIYIVSYDNKNIEIKNTEFIQLHSERPLKEIQYLLSSISNDDIVIMLPKSDEIYKSPQPILSSVNSYKTLPKSDEIYKSPECILLNNNDDDTVVMFTKHERHKSLLEKCISLYCNDYPAIAFSVNDIDKTFIKQTRDVFRDDDTLIFKKGHMRRSMRDLSTSSTYDKIRQKIIRQCADSILYAPEDRTPGYMTPEERKKKEQEEQKERKEREEREKKEQEERKERGEEISTDQSKKGFPRTYKVRINLGIGDILFARGVLDRQSKTFDKVYISPDYNVYNDTRQPTKKETDFTNKLLELIFQPPYYHLETERIEEYPHRFCQTFSTLDNFPLVVPQLSDVLCEGKPLDIGPYITISTRVREVPITEYEEKVKKQFLKKVLELSETYKIVILGERELSEYKEHEILAGQVFTLYKDLIETLPKNRVVDLSFKNVKTIRENRMKRFKQECLYMRDAEWNIVVGNGGNSCIAASIGNAMGYFSPSNPHGDYYNRMFGSKQKHTSVYYSSDVDKFIKKLSDITKPKPTYDICVNMGIGDLLIIRGELDKAKDKFSQINITPNTPFFNRIRSKEYTNGFINDFIKLLFPPPYYNLTTNLKYPTRDGHGVQVFDGIPIASPHHLKDLFCVGKSLDIGPYVTINTKVRIVQKSSYNNFKSRFYDSLNTVAEKYKIVILGDRCLPNWQEFKMFPSDIFTIYDDIIKFLPKERCVDLTFDNLHKGSLKQVKQDCVYMRDAVNNIFLGAAGAWCLGLVAGKSISYYEPKTNGHWNEYATIKSNTYLTDDLEKYFYWMTQL